MKLKKSNLSIVICLFKTISSVGVRKKTIKASFFIASNFRHNTRLLFSRILSNFKSWWLITEMKQHPGSWQQELLLSKHPNSGNWCLLKGWLASTRCSITKPALTESAWRKYLLQNNDYFEVGIGGLLGMNMNHLYIISVNQITSNLGSREII
jgi:hypothetical protein